MRYVNTCVISGDTSACSLRGPGASVRELLLGIKALGLNFTSVRVVSPATMKILCREAGVAGSTIELEEPVAIASFGTFDLKSQNCDAVLRGVLDAERTAIWV